MSEDLRGPNVLNFNKVSMTQVNRMGNLQLRIYGGRIIFLSFFYLRERVFIISCMDFLGILMQFKERCRSKPRAKTEKTYITSRPVSAGFS